MNGDGIGDFAGLIRRLDYLSYIGVNCLWLLPFYPTPNRDDGYDVTGVDAFVGLDQPGDLFCEMQEFVTVRRGDAMLLGEADLPFEELNDYFDGGGKFHALFNFAVPRYLFLGLALEKADPIAFAIDELPSAPSTAVWFNFLRHHDELSLMRLTVDQRDEIYDAFGSSPDMQIYDRGLRRRIAPMLNGDEKRIRLAFSLLFAFQGVPVIYYGNEIGMGEDLSLPGRSSVRTPMQWTPFDNGGFSSAPPDRFARPIISTGDFGFDRVDVWDQRADDDSLLNWLVRLIRTRRECREIGSGSLRKLHTRDEAVLGLRYDGDEDAIIILNNLARRGRTVVLELSDRERKTATELCADRQYASVGDDPSQVRIGGYGFRWIRVNRCCETSRAD